jgi:hypothetical protein
MQLTRKYIICDTRRKPKKKGIKKGKKGEEWDSAKFWPYRNVSFFLPTR